MVLYLGQALLYAVIAMLVVHCLKSVEMAAQHDFVRSGRDGLRYDCITYYVKEEAMYHLHAYYTAKDRERLKDFYDEVKKRQIWAGILICRPYAFRFSAESGQLRR